MATKTRSADYRMGYQSGRNARDRSKWETEMRHQAECLAVAERAERAEKAQGLGHCEDCQHWHRPDPNFAWGTCTAPKAPGTPFGCWAQAQETQTFKPVQIATSPRFGCVLFMARTAGVTAAPTPLDTSRAAFELWAANNPGDELPITGAMWGSGWLYDDPRTRAAYAMWCYLHRAYAPRTAGVTEAPPPANDDPEKHPDFYTWTWDVWVSGGNWKAEYGWKKPAGKVQNLQPLFKRPDGVEGTPK